jgi:DNA/RNA-binding domain of Phe-tRNA-synthetase-like protein
MQLDDVQVSPQVWELRPDFALLALLAEDLAVTESTAESQALLDDARTTAPGDDAPTDPHVLAWQEAYRAFGTNPRRQRPSVDALLRRAPSGLPAVNAVVDAYNAVSVVFRLPVGGEDADQYVGRPRLTVAHGDERFDTVTAGQPTIDHPAAGEVVWRDDIGVTCRAWNWRQCVRTRVTEGTKRAVFQLERLEPMPLHRLEAAADALTGHLERLSPGVRITRRLFSRANRL